jgi:hypothetical protein
MANISEARGYIALDGPWNKEQIVNILYVLYSQDSSLDYSMYIASSKITEDIDELSQGHGISFSASGRWAFTTNLQAFHDWTDLSEDSYKYTRTYDMGVPYEEYTQRRKQVMLDMIRNKLSINFNFADIEPGLNVAYKANAEIAAEYYYDTTTGTSETQFVTRLGNEEPYDCNLKFLCEEIRDDTEPLYEFIYQLAGYKNIKFKDDEERHTILDQVARDIQKDDDWFNISAYPDPTNEDTKITDLINSYFLKQVLK